MTVSPKLAARYEIGDLLVDVGLRRVTRGGEEVPLGRLTFDLLVALAERAPRVVTQRELDKCVWADRVVNPETVAQRIKILRQSLGDDAHHPRYIRVVRGQGYQLIPPVERLSSEPSESAPVPPPAPPEPNARRAMLTRLALVTAVAVLAVAAVSWEVVSPSRSAAPVAGFSAPDDAGDSAVTRFSMHVPVSIRQYLGGAPRAVLALSRDGRRVVFSAGELTLRSLDSLTLQTLPGTTDAHQPFFSPDGEWVAYFTSMGELKKVHVGGEAPPVTVAAAAPHGADGFSFGIWRDDGTIVYGNGDASLSVVSADGGTPERIELAADSGQRVGGPMGIVAGTGEILFTFGRSANDTNVELYDWRTHEHVPVIENAWLSALTASSHLLFVRDGLLMAAPFDVTHRKVGIAATVRADIERDGVGAIRQFGVSANGTLAYLVGHRAASEATELGWVSRDGEFTLLTMLPPLGEPRTLDVSPDFRSVLTTGGRNRGVVTLLFDVDARVLKPLGVDTLSAKWHPDGQRVALGGKKGLRIWNSADATETVVDSSVKDAQSVSFSADGKSLIYVAQRPDDNIYTFDILKRKESALLDTAAGERLPTVSPDGRWIAYVSDEAGESAVYIARVADVEDRRRVTPGGSYAPVWSGRGNELYFAAINLAKRQTEMQSVTVLTADALELGEPRTVFAVPFQGTADGYRYAWGNTLSPMFDVAPDGERFLMMRFPPDRTDPTADIVVVQNWFRELNQLAPPIG